MVNFSLEGKDRTRNRCLLRNWFFCNLAAYAEAGAKIVFNDIKQELVDKGIAARC